MEFWRSGRQSEAQEFRREGVPFGKPRCSAIPPCSSQAGVDPRFQFIRWEFLACM
jgi:hypothetical protein